MKNVHSLPLTLLPLTARIKPYTYIDGDTNSIAAECFTQALLYLMSQTYKFLICHAMRLHCNFYE